MKKIFVSLIIICLLVVPMTSNATASGERTYATLNDYLENEIDQYFEQPTWEFIEFNPTNRATPTKSTIDFPITYLVSVFTYDSFGGIENVDFDKVIFTSSDDQVAYVDVLTYDIYAKGPGHCTIRIEYGDMTQEIAVSVGRQVDENMLRLPTETLIRERSENTTQRAVTRESIHQKAIDIKGYAWYATKPYPIWGNEQTAYLSTGTRFGLPYTQYPYYDEIEFAYYLATTPEEQFYKQGDIWDQGKEKHLYFGYYGLDCSGFVSKCWQLPYKYYTGLFASNYRALSGGMADLDTGDALLRYNGTEGHIMLVTQNQGPSGYLVIIHQTVPETEWKFSTYSQAQADGYWPISYFNPGGN